MEQPIRRGTSSALTLFQLIAIMAFPAFFIFMLSIEKSPTCEQYNAQYLNEAGSYRVEQLGDAWGHHCSAICGFHGEKMLYLKTYDLALPEKGDSIYKEKGTLTYILVKKDSTYAQFLSCTPFRFMAVTAWKNGDSVDLRQVIK